MTLPAPNSAKALVVGLEIAERRAKMQAFLTAFAGNGIILTGCQAASVSRATFYAWMTKSADDPPDPAYCVEIEGVLVPFAKLVEQAGEVAADRIEAEVVRRAVEGVERPQFYQGQIVGHVREWSDILAIFVLKSRRPKFRDNYRVEV